LLRPDSEIVAETEEMISGGLPVSPFPYGGWAVARGEDSGIFNRDNGSKKEDYEEE
jgi:hypothetical protein